MSVEGAMLGGYMFPEAEFISLMTQLLERQGDQVEAYLRNTQRAIASGNLKEAYESWQLFFTSILRNPTTSLLAITNFYGNTKTQTWNFVAQEENAINKAGQINIQSVEQGIRREYNSQILTEHLSNLFRDVKTEMTKSESNYLWGLKTSGLKARLSEAKQAGTYIYKQVVYGDIANKGGIFYSGKIADAYLNHLGDTHADILNSFLQTGNLPSDHLKNASVKQEEKARGRLNFIKLLMESTNRTAWYTGGDLIITNGSGQVVANIQLKVSAKEGKWIGNIRTAELNQKIETILTLIKTSNLDTAKEFYNMLKTSSVGERVGTAAIEEAYQMVRNNFNIPGVTIT